MAALDAALNLVKHLPPQNIVQNLSSLLELAPDLTEDLLSSVDQPLQVAVDTNGGKDFLLCDYNRDGDSYRSPWTNEYFPPLDDGARPSDKLRKLEIEANEIFNSYRDQYYEAGVASVYLWDVDEDAGSFAGCFLVHKGEGSGKHGGLEKALWDAIHVVEVTPAASASAKSAKYSLTSTVMLHLGARLGERSQMSLAGSLSRTAAQEAAAASPASHIVTIGRMIEEMENKLRNTLDSVYFGKTREVVANLRASDGVMAVDRRQSMQTNIMSEMLKKPVGGAGPMAGFDPKAALAGLRSAKKPAAPPAAAAEEASQ